MTYKKNLYKFIFWPRFVKQYNNLMDEDSAQSKKIKEIQVELDRQLQQKESEQHFVHLALEAKRTVESTEQ